MITARVNLIVAAVVAFLGMFVWWGTFGIDTDAGMFEGPRLLPSIVGTGLLLLAGALVLSGPDLNPAESSEAAEEKASPISQWRGLKQVAIPLTIMVLVYVGLMNGFGYLISTILIAPFAFMLFGNQGLKQILLFPVALAIVYYIIFFQLLGLFDPPGSILDISEMFINTNR